MKNLKNRSEETKNAKQLTVADLEHVTGGALKRDLESPASEEPWGKEEEIRSPIGEI